MFQNTNKLILTIKITFTILLIFAFVWVGAYFFIKSDEEVNDSDLYLSFQKLPAENNGYVIIGTMGKQIIQKTPSRNQSYIICNSL